MVNTAFVVAVLGVPLFLLLVVRRAMLRTAVLVTSALTWASATAAYWLLRPDPSDVGAVIFFCFAILPLATIPVATVTATAVTHQRKEWLSAAFLAAIGWGAGLVVMVIIPVYGSTRDLWEGAITVVAPAVYAACGAAYAAARPQK